MEDAARLKIAFGLIVTGLHEKKRKKKRGEYCPSRKLMGGMNQFFYLKRKYNPDGFDFNEMNECSFITNYAIKPVATWFVGWKVPEEVALVIQELSCMDALVGDSGFDTFCLGEDCEDYMEHVIKNEYTAENLVAEFEQRAVYDALKLLNQEDYVSLRKYIILHPTVTASELRREKCRYSENKNALRVIENAYEEIYIQGKPGASEELRLRRGVMKYISVPGKLELEIYDYCSKQKVQSELWPEMDRYDLRITFSDGEIWAVDAKTIRRPQFLKENIIRDDGFPKGEYQKGFYVIPDEYADARTDYLEIINRQLEQMDNQRIQCVSWRKLKKEIRERRKEHEGNKKEV